MPDATRPREPRPFRPADEFLAIDPAALERAWSLFELDEDDPPPDAKPEGGVAVVEIHGPLESRAGWFWDGYGGEFGVVARFKRAMADATTSAVVLHIASPGGVCAGLHEALDEMRAATTKPVVAFAADALSAGYALATVAEKIFVSRASGVGSIGTIATAVSYEKRLEQDGVAVAVVSSGAYKADLHPALPLSEAAIGRLRARVQQLAGMFADEVAGARAGLTRERVLAQQAAVFHGEAAVQAGLADGIGTLSAAIDAARSLATERAAQQAAEEKRMSASAMMTALGLAATATEAEAAVEAGTLREIKDKLCELTGKASAREALGVAMAWKADAAAAAEARAALATEREAARKRDVEAQVDAKIAEHKLAPAQRDWAVALGAKDPELFRGFLGSLTQALVAAPGAFQVPARPASEPSAALLAQEAASVGMSVEEYTKAQDGMRKAGVMP